MLKFLKPRKPKTKRKGKPDPALLSEIVRRIVEVSQPDEIYLFGSAARGEMDEHSDFDFLVEFSSEAEIDLIKFGKIQTELENIVMRKVDLVPKDGLKNLIRAQILAEAEVFYAE